MKKSLILISLFIFSSITNILSDNSSEYEFAESLFKERYYSMAIPAYKRAIFFSKDPELIAKSHYRLGQCFQMEKKVNQAILHFLKSTNLSELKTKAFYQIGYTKYLAGSYSSAVKDLDYFQKTNPSSIFADRALYLSARACIQDFRWKDALDRYELLLETYPNSIYASNSMILKQLMIKGLSLPKKHGWLSGIMSAILPGSGQIYCNRYVDGITAFFLNGAFLGLTFLSYENDKIKDWAVYVSGSLFGIFYSANIYGAINAAANGTLIIRHNYREFILTKFPAPEPLE